MNSATQRTSENAAKAEQRPVDKRPRMSEKLRKHSQCTRLVCDCMNVTTRSQAVARVADRTASQQLWRSRDVIAHVTI